MKILEMPPAHRGIPTLLEIPLLQAILPVLAAHRENQILALKTHLNLLEIDL
ncbi:hypothetical protein GCM10023189_33010 [Nibrella saemangeumensis]|uniref:Uncharacterized protein n=1 Tax=Nibrella saemangeumensis TaxID=1084526 RepID=A0ABP8N0S6_9BACT